MTIAEYIALSITGIYSLTILVFSIGWIKLRTFVSSSISDTIPISIVIACRNEEDNISFLLKSLINQTYLNENTEIIIIDDHSEDNTRKIIAEYIKKNKFIKLLELPGNKTGKKEALAYGIKNSNSDVIITTDADCTTNKNWLNTLVSYYIQFKPKLLVGPVAFNYRNNNIFQKLQAFEFLSLIGSGAGAIGINKPIMCNGANLLFEKSLYENSNIKNHIASGDDIFLMLYAKRINKKSIHFIRSKEAIVYTKPVKSVKEFLNQRIRWTSKSKTYRDFDIIFTALIVTFTNLILALGFVYTIWDFSFLNTFILLFIIKSIFDLLILIPVTKFFYPLKLLWLFFPLQIIYPFYIVFTVIFGLIGNFNWKDRYFQEKG
ncbi:MAG: glycosyltransferase [Bacteroidales bacterium]|nr:glycosyltransferase [Bacteroidales bacterium]